MPDIVTLGELRIDFVPTVSGVTLIEAPTFKKAAGGAAANVAAGLAKLGIPTGFMGKVGDDAFGHFLAQTLEQTGVDISALRFTREARTTLAFVSLSADGEREFIFYRHLDRDMLLMYSPGEVDVEYIRTAKAFHFGSISLITEPSRSATLHAIRAAQSSGLQISYDPNLRLNLWPSAEVAKAGLMLGWPLAHIIKVSEEELAFLAGVDLEGLGDLRGLEAAARQLWHPNLRLLVVTCGKAGSRYITPSFCGETPGFVVDAVDTTGAGEGVVAGLLKGLYEHPRADQDESLLREICRYANAVGAITTTERGAIPALPTAEQVERFLQAPK